MFEPRDLELFPAPGSVACRALRRADRLAGRPQTQVPHRVSLKMNSGMNRLGFTPLRYRSAGAAVCLAAGGRDLAHDAFLRRRRPRGIAHQMAAFATATQDLPGERSLCNSAATLRHAQDAGARRLGCALASCSTAARPTFLNTAPPAGMYNPPVTLSTSPAGRANWVGDTVELRLALHRRGPSPLAWSPAAMPTATRAIGDTGTLFGERRCVPPGGP